ncbi:hypothetical protein OF83DRAFT_1068250 [Amylostereum chailletii]|nr:hypothetical protein OF83DRAFT_1068250 [Amylostereum chailletii]
MSKQIEDFAVRRVRYNTDLPVQEVLRRLDALLNRNKSEGRITSAIRAAKSPRELESRLKEVTGEHFGFFLETKHSNWLRMYLERDDIPDARVYTLGNPLVAATMMRHDLLAGLYVPLRLMIMGKTAEGGRGTRVVYDLPSSMIAGGDRGELRRAAEELDRMLEELVQKITGVA